MRIIKLTTLLTSTFFILSCGDDSCKTCIRYEENNLAAAELYCEGTITNLDDAYDVTNESTIEVCGNDAFDNTTIVSVSDICENVMGVTRIRLDCD